MAQAPDTTSLEYSFHGLPLVVAADTNVSLSTADDTFADDYYYGAPAQPIYGHPTDSGSDTVSFTTSGSESVVAASHGNSGQSGGGLGNHTGHPAFTADMMYLEKYTFVEGVTVVQYQWQYQGTSGLTEHWKLTVYYDDGSGSNPGALYYQGAEQTRSIPNSGTNTASVSPTDLTIPAGSYWIGTHLKEGNAAPTHTGGGTVVDAPDTYSDGAADPFVNGTADTNLRDVLITTTTSPGLGFVASKTSEALVDSGTATVSFTATGITETGIDAGSDTVSFTATQTETLVDQGETTVTLDPSTPSEPITDQGEDTVSFTDEMVSEAIAETAADDVSFTPDQSYSVTTSGATDSGDDTVTFTDEGTEALVDAGADTVSFTPAGTQALVDQGSTTVSFTTSKVREAIAEATSQTVTFAITKAEALVDQSTANVLEIATAAEAIALTGAATVSFTVASASQAIADAGAPTLVLTPSGVYTLVVTGTTTVVFTPDADEALVDATATGFGFDATADSEAIADQGADDVELVPDVSGDVAVADEGTVGIGSDLGQLEAIADAGAETVVFTPFGHLRRLYHYGRVSTNVAGLRDGLAVAVSTTSLDVSVVQTARVDCTITAVEPLDATLTPAATLDVSVR